MLEVFYIAGAVLASTGAAAGIVLALSNWLGRVWANRLLEQDKSLRAMQLEALTRKRNIYAKLAISMRVFLKPHEARLADRRADFLEAYDEAFLWASDDVINELGHLIDSVTTDTADPREVPMSVKRDA